MTANEARRSTLELVVLLLAIMTSVGFVVDMVPSINYDMPAAMYGVVGTGIGALGAAAVKGKASE